MSEGYRVADYDLFHSPPPARRSDPETSHDAGLSIPSVRVTETQEAVLQILRRLGPMTDEDLARIYERRAERGEAPRSSPSGLRTRRAELVDDGRAADSGRRTTLASGRRAILWVAR